MFSFCHRCGGDLTSAGIFCPHCGAPQLLLPEECLADQPQLRDLAADTTGALPPPLPRQIDWQAAFRCAALVGVVAAILCVLGLRLPPLSFLGTIWILTASTTSLSLYLRRRPGAWMDGTVGARIGMVTGLSMIVFIAVSMAVSGLVARYGLHAMGGFDAGFAQMFEQVKQTARETAASTGAPVPAEVLRLYDIPEFRAGVMLSSLGLGAILLIAFTALGGALNGVLRHRSRQRV